MNAQFTFKVYREHGSMEETTHTYNNITEEDAKAFWEELLRAHPYASVEKPPQFCDPFDAVGILAIRVGLAVPAPVLPTGEAAGCQDEPAGEAIKSDKDTSLLCTDCGAGLKAFEYMHVAGKNYCMPCWDNKCAIKDGVHAGTPPPTAIPAGEQATPVYPPRPTEQERQTGLMGKYHIEHADGTPCDADAEYFVLRLDYHDGCDHKHVDACRRAIQVYAEEVRNHLPALSRDLRLMYPVLNAIPAGEVPGTALQVQAMQSANKELAKELDSAREKLAATLAERDRLVDRLHGMQKDVDRLRQEAGDYKAMYKDIVTQLADAKRDIAGYNTLVLNAQPAHGTPASYAQMAGIVCGEHGFKAFVVNCPACGEAIQIDPSLVKPAHSAPVAPASQTVVTVTPEGRLMSAMADALNSLLLAHADELPASMRNARETWLGKADRIEEARQNANLA